jgi:hypothetical protein
MIRTIQEGIEIEEFLVSRLNIIFDFWNTTPTIINVSIRRIEHNNLTYIELHRIIINNTLKSIINISLLLLSKKLSNLIFMVGIKT